MILDRVEADRADAMPDKMTKAKFYAAFFDPFTWSFAMMFMASTMPAYAMGFFSTIIIHGMGFSTAMALLLTAPPYCAAVCLLTFHFSGIPTNSNCFDLQAISCYFFAWIADKTRKRAVYLAIQNVITMAGIIATGYAPQPGVRYFGVFLTTMGASGCVPGVLAYVSIFASSTRPIVLIASLMQHSNNITQHTKRAVSTAVIIAMGGVGGIFATLVFRQADYPSYIPGVWATMACQITMLILLGVNTYVFARRNRLYREGKCEPLEGTPGFYYTL